MPASGDLFTTYLREYPVLVSYQVAELRGVTPGTVRLSLDTGALDAARLPGLAVRLVYAANAVEAKRKPGRDNAQKVPRP